MYFRPGNLVKDFVIEPVITGKTTTGRASTSYDTETHAVLRGVLSAASPEAIQRYDQAGHPITHEIVQRGGAKAKPGDRLARDHVYYYVQGVDNIAAMSVATIYYVEERADLDHGSRI